MGVCTSNSSSVVGRMSQYEITDSIDIATMRKKRRGSDELRRFPSDASVATLAHDKENACNEADGTSGALDIAARIEEVLTNNSIVLFSRIWCPLCKDVKEALAERAVHFTVVELEDMLVGGLRQEFKRCLQEKTGIDSLPWTFVKGRSLGSHEDIMEMEADGRLADLCEDAGAPAPEERMLRTRSGSRTNLTPGTPRTERKRRRT